MKPSHTSSSASSASTSTEPSVAQWTWEQILPPVTSCVRYSASVHGTTRLFVSTRDLDYPKSEGHFKFVAYGEFTRGKRTKQPAVVKWIKPSFSFVDIDEHALLQEEVRASHYALRIVARFNRRCGHNIHVVMPQVWTVTCADRTIDDRSHLLEQPILVEPFLEGFQKFSSNYGWVNKGLEQSDLGKVLLALSHFSYAVSKEELLLTDLQGGFLEDGSFALTDVALHSADGMFGDSDLGCRGMRKFFDSHTCNEYCNPSWSKSCED